MATILIADDDAHIRQLLRLTLAGNEHEVLEAADGDAALAAVRAHRPTVAILDVQMPGLSGLEVCRLVRADPSFAGTRVMVVSANASEEQATVAGADVFLAKPFSPARLLAVLADLVARPSAPRAPRHLRELRAERLLTISDLARTVGVASETVHEIETGALQPRRTMVRRISAALGVDPRDVTEFGPQPPTPPEGGEPDMVIARLEVMGYPRALAQRVGRRRPSGPGDG